MYCVYEKNFIYCDVKFFNIFLDDMLWGKFGDFGIVKDLEMMMIVDFGIKGFVLYFSLE